MKDEKDVDEQFRKAVEELKQKGLIEDLGNNQLRLKEKGKEVFETQLLKDLDVRLYYGEILTNMVKDEYDLEPSKSIAVAHWIIRDRHDVSLLHAMAEKDEEMPFHDIDVLDENIMKFESKRQFIEAIR